jgi:hypothetical protein
MLAEGRYTTEGSEINSKRYARAAAGNLGGILRMVQLKKKNTNLTKLNTKFQKKNALRAAYLCGSFINKYFYVDNKQ